jgi:fatty acid-binding protein DegV
MGKTAFIIDSTAPLTDKLKKKAYFMFSDNPHLSQGTVPEIFVMPLYLNYKDVKGNDISRKENEIQDIVSFLAEHGNRSVMTSQVTPQDFMEAFKFADQLGYSRAIGMFIPYQMSKTCASAQLAAAEFGNENHTLREIYTPNSISGSGEVTLALEQLLAEDPDIGFGSLKAKADGIAGKSRIWLIPENLEGLEVSGRISHLLSGILSSINYLPLLSVYKKGDNAGKFLRERLIKSKRPENKTQAIVEAASEYLSGKGRSLAYVINRNMDELSELLSTEASKLSAFGGGKIQIVKDVSNIIYKIVGPATALAVLPAD